MVEFLPLRGLRYSPEYAGPNVYAPPYDVITPEQQRRYLARSPYNVVRLILGPDPYDLDWHAGAAATLGAWVARGILTCDPSPRFYGYQQHFKLSDGHVYKRAGFIGRMRLRTWGMGVYRHEHTRTGPREDRLRLIRATRMNLSPVFGLYRDPCEELTRWLEPPLHPMLDFQDDEGVRQIFWPIEDDEAIAGISRSMAEREVVIADGHHRYETALAYQAERRATDGNPPQPQLYDYVLIYLTASEGSGLHILPSHRLILREPTVQSERLLQALARDFDLFRVNGSASLSEAVRTAARGTVAIGLCLAQEGAWVLRLKDLGIAHRTAGERGLADPEIAELDVCVLQHLILEPHLNISSEDLASAERVSYVIHEEEACRQVHEGKAQAAFILNPTTVEQVWRAAKRGAVLPQKSTYFYPKLLTGLVFNPLDAEWLD